MLAGKVAAALSSMQATLETETESRALLGAQSPLKTLVGSRTDVTQTRKEVIETLPVFSNTLSASSSDLRDTKYILCISSIYS